MSRAEMLIHVAPITFPFRTPPVQASPALQPQWHRSLVELLHIQLQEKGVDPHPGHPFPKCETAVASTLQGLAVHDRTPIKPGCQTSTHQAL